MTPLGISSPIKTTLNNQGLPQVSSLRLGVPGSTFQHLAFVQTVRELHHLHLGDRSRWYVLYKSNQKLFGTHIFKQIYKLYII